MRDKLKIVTIGGGSSYTPELMEGFIKRYHELPIKEIWLVDIEEGKEKMEIVGNLAQRMWDAAGYPVKVHLTLDRREALKDADFVTTQFRVGRLYARIKDERIPFSYGMLGQETNGAGGNFKAFRTIPVILDIVNDMKELCPNAWLINFTNPSGMVIEAIIKHGKWKKCIGLCNVGVNLMIREPEALGMSQEDCIYRFAGLNHFHWHRVTDKYGNNLKDKIVQKTYEGVDMGVPVNILDIPPEREQQEVMDCIPCGYHRYYYNYDVLYQHGYEEYLRNETRAEMVKKTEDGLFELYKDPNLKEKPKLLEKRGGKNYSNAACECVSAIYNDKRHMMVVSTQNDGAISCLANDSIVEVSAYITGQGAQPIAWGEFQSAERGWLQLMKAMEECTIEAAITGNYGMALQAFMMNPCIISGHNAKQMLDEMLVAHEKYLPQFKDKIQELKAQGVYPKDPVVVDLMKNNL